MADERSEQNPEPPLYVAMARYGYMRFVDRFTTEMGDLKKGDHVVARTGRGVELAEVIAPSEPAPQHTEDARPETIGEIIRRATPDDDSKGEDIQRDEQPAELDFCLERIRERNLPMKLVMVERLFGGRKIIFYFVADGRVDFRELVRDLAQQYHCRIEMRQIGVRDEARLLADYEHCGRPLCCRTFIQKLEPVSMRMAKSQKATLDPNKISGRCGRLMCCLRFEDAAYEECRRSLPRKGQRVNTPQGPGVVIEQEILQRRVKVDLREGGQVVFPADDVEVVQANRPSEPCRRRGSSGRGGKGSDPQPGDAEPSPDSKGD